MRKEVKSIVCIYMEIGFSPMYFKPFQSEINYLLLCSSSCDPISGCYGGWGETYWLEIWNQLLKKF